MWDELTCADLSQKVSSNITKLIMSNSGKTPKEQLNECLRFPTNTISREISWPPSITKANCICKSMFVQSIPMFPNKDGRELGRALFHESCLYISRRWSIVYKYHQIYHSQLYDGYPVLLLMFGHECLKLILNIYKLWVTPRGDSFTRTWKLIVSNYRGLQ